jgi:hypothetical protein
MPAAAEDTDVELVAPAPAAPAAPAAAPVIDLLGGDDYLIGDATMMSGTPAAAAAAAAAGPVDPLADLFGGPSSAPAAAAASNDPFASLGLSNGGAAPAVAAGAAAAAAGVAGGESPGEFKLAGDIVSWRQALLSKERGILYEDSFLQVRGGRAWPR